MNYRRLVTVLAVAALVPAAASCQKRAETAQVKGEAPVFEAKGELEFDLGEGWIAAGQPSRDRLREVIEAGARVVSIRTPGEDSFDEAKYVEQAGGSFKRHPVSGSKYADKAFREAVYDLIDAEKKAGGKVYFHCASSNRIGAAWALYHAERKGIAAKEALAMGEKAGLRSLAPLVRDVLGL